MKLRIKNNYGIIPNDIINEPTMTLKSKGLFAYIQSKPDGWSFSVKRISRQNKDGEVGVASAVRELEDSGYLKRVKFQNKKGHWDIEYCLLEKPQTAETLVGKTQTRETLLSGNPQTKKERLSKKDSSKKDIVPEPVIHLNEDEMLHFLNNNYEETKSLTHKVLLAWHILRIKSGDKNIEHLTTKALVNKSLFSARNFVSAKVVVGYMEAGLDESVIETGFKKSLEVWSNHKTGGKLQGKPYTLGWLINTIK